MDKWDKFISAAREHKLDVKGTYSLIYVGAFDELFNITNESYSDKLKIYRKAELELKQATGSSAILPSKTKTQLIGLDEVDGAADLIKWRQQVNPVSKNKIISIYETALKERGFNHSHNNPDFNFVKKIEIGARKYKKHLITDRWMHFFHKYGQNRELMSQMRDSNEYAVYYFIFIDQFKEFQYGGDKKALKLFGSSGEEIITDLVIWPEYGTSKLPSWSYKITKGMGHIFKLNIYLAKTGEYKYNMCDVDVLTDKVYGKKS